MKMPSELKQKWIEALRDPTRKQIRSKLGDKAQGQCCLGVLCEVGGVEYSQNQPIPTNQQLADMRVEDFFSVAPGDTQETSRDVLIAMNDTQRTSFTVIADYIEANVEAV